jgi:tRNA A37 methylthiotransferase MiaB
MNDISKIYVESVGCFMSQTETNHIAAYLSTNGYELVDAVDQAESIILTTCAVFAERADHTQNVILEHLSRRLDGTPIYVVGCFTRIEKQRMNELTSKHENVHAVEEVEKIQEIFAGNSSWDSVGYNDFFSHPYYEKMTETAGTGENLKGKIIRNTLSLCDSVFKKNLLDYYMHRHIPYNLFFMNEETRLWTIIASKGCTHNCSFCAVRMARGKYRSKPISSIVAEIKAGVEKGYRRVILMGDELGSYGVDFKDGSSMSSLIETIVAEDLPVQVGLWYFDCFKLAEAVPALEVLAEREQLFFMGIPIQSGSKRILKLMNRRYSLDESLEIIGRLRRYPKLIMATIFMVGFPTETEEDFLETVKVAETGYFDNAAVYCFSVRPGTRAAEMEDDVPGSVKLERRKKLEEIVGRWGRKRLLNYIRSELIS